MGQRAEAQEVSMFFKTKDRVEAQNLRILNRDFPWLWAVKNSWWPQYTHIKIQETDHYLQSLMLTTATGDEKNELWVRYTRGKFSNHSAVEKVSIRKGELMANLTFEAITCGDIILNIFIVQDYDVESGAFRMDNGEPAFRTVTIYRPPKEMHFNCYLGLIRNISGPSLTT